MACASGHRLTVLSVVLLVTGLLSLLTESSATADIYRWDNGQLVTRRNAGPRTLFEDIDLSHANLVGASLSQSEFHSVDLGSASLADADLTDTWFWNSTLINANLSGALVEGAYFVNVTSLSKEQLYSTASYTGRNLQGIRLGAHDLTGWDFSGQDLTDSRFSVYGFPDVLYASRLTDADFTGAVVTGASFGRYPEDGMGLPWGSGTGITKEQLYSTASYQEKNLRGIDLQGNDLSGWDFSGQDLRYATFFRVLGLNSAVFTSDTVYNQWTLFPEDFDPEAAGMTFMESPRGDFDGNDVLDISDVEILTRKIRKPGPFGGLDLDGSTDFRHAEFWFDLDGNWLWEQEDLRIWVKDLKQTWFGDANLDGQFDSLDLTNLLQAGQYEDGVYENSSWSTGDWNADGEFDRLDLVLALQDGGYGQGPRAALVGVPEPTAIVLAAMGFLGLLVIGWHRRGRGHTAS